MIEIVKENPCAECGIKGLYEHCEDKCVQYRKWYQYQQGRADAIDEFIDKVSESIIWDILAEIMKRNIGASEGSSRIIEHLQKVAEQLKEQKN